MSVPSKLIVTVNGKQKEKEFPRHDQVAAELLYFSDCILKNREPEPSGLEGLADMRIIRAIYDSAQSGNPVKVESIAKKARPSSEQEVNLPPHRQTELFHAESPTQD